jgi:Fic family protein
MDAINQNPPEITPQILDLVAQIDEFKGRWETLGNLPTERLDRLSAISARDAIAATHRLEGAELTEATVARLMARQSLKSFANRTEQLAAGYAETLARITRQAMSLECSGYHLKELHRQLHAYGDKDSWHRGKYKTSVTSQGAMEQEGHARGFIFDVASAFETPRLMTQLFSWYQTTRENRSLHPLLAIAMFVAMFLRIAPFQDGNARMSRLIITLLLLKAGYSHARYSPIESAFEADVEEYFQSRLITSRSLGTQRPHWTPWLAFFLTAVRSQCVHLAHKLERERQVAARMPSLSLAILEHARHHGRLTMAGAILITGASRHTLKPHFRQLVDAGHLTRHGGGRSVWYGLY